MIMHATCIVLLSTLVKLVVAAITALGGVGEVDVHSVPSKFSKFDGARTYSGHGTAPGKQLANAHRAVSQQPVEDTKIAAQNADGAAAAAATAASARCGRSSRSTAPAT